MAQTSDRVSTIAARYINTSAQDVAVQAEANPERLARDIRGMAASLLRQD
jgi:hypothetical protein